MFWANRMGKISIQLAISLCSLSHLLTLICFASIDSNTTITLRPEVEITGERILLGQIANIKTADEALNRKLERVDLGRANPVGRSRTITVSHIKTRMVRYQLDGAQYTFIGSTSTARRKELTVPSDEILKAATAFYRERLTLEGSHVELQIQSKMPVRPLRIPNENVRLRFTPLNEDLWQGSLKVEAIDGTRVTGQAILAFTVSAVVPVIVAAKEIPAHTVLKREYLRLEQRKVEKPSGSLFTRIEALVGKTTKTKIPQSEIITDSHVKRNYLVSKGSVVTIVAQRGTLQVRGSGRALENGTQGQRIRVTNTTSRKELIGEVIGENLIHVHF